jgi:hypothetical protein
MTPGARTPEELETLLEDAFVTRDPAALAQLFETGAALAAGPGRPGPAARGRAAIVRLAGAMWAHDRTYVADAPCVVQAGDTALVVAPGGTSVVRRGADGAWRYAIAVLCLYTEKEGEE